MVPLPERQILSIRTATLLQDVHHTVGRRPSLTALRASNERDIALRSRGVAVALKKREHPSPVAAKEQQATLANLITCLRAVLITSIFVLAGVWASRDLLLLGLATSWATDVLDGFVARRFRCESVLGAQLDYNVDRLVATAAIVTAAVISGNQPLVLVAAGIAWIQYGAFDQLICSQFLRSPSLWSPDDFWVLDETTWRLNWAPVAKIAGHVPLVLLAIGGYGLFPSIGLALLLITIRACSYFRAAPQIAIAIQIRSRADHAAHTDPRPDEVILVDDRDQPLLRADARSLKALQRSADTSSDSMAANDPRT